jgi:hypothetical protein
MRHYTAAISFENWVTPPQTVRLTVSGSTHSAALRRALVAANKQMPGAHWRSLVVVLEKADPPAGAPLK